jgi:hypothetical protein
MQSDQQSQQNESVMNRAWQGVEGSYQNVADQASHLRENTEHYVQEAPFTASLVSFGVGVGLGLLVSQLLIPSRSYSRQSHWYDSYLGDDRAQAMEDMAQRYLPRSVTRRMGM